MRWRWNCEICTHPRCIFPNGCDCAYCPVFSMATSYQRASLPPSNTENLWPRRVHILYKRPEIPANTAIPALAISVTYRNRRRRRIRVRSPLALPTDLISVNYKTAVQGWACAQPQKGPARARFQNEIARAIYGGVLRFRAKMPANEVEPPQRKERPEQGSAIRAALDGTFHRRALLVGRDLPHF